MIIDQQHSTLSPNGSSALDDTINAVIRGETSSIVVGNERQKTTIQHENSANDGQMLEQSTSFSPAADCQQQQQKRRGVKEGRYGFVKFK